MSENLQLLQALANRPSAIAWFKELLDEIRLNVTDTGEQFTIVNHGDRVEVLSGFHAPSRRKILFGLLDPGDWYAQQFIIPLQSQNIRNLSAVFADNVVDAEELYRIMAFIAPHLLQAALGIPAMRNKFLLKLFKLDTFWHQCLLDPQGNETQPCTVALTHGQWLIIPGYHGQSQRKKVLTAQKLLEFQRRVHQAEQENSLSGWLALGTWYQNWLESLTAR